MLLTVRVRASWGMHGGSRSFRVVDVCDELTAFRIEENGARKVEPQSEWLSCAGATAGMNAAQRARSVDGREDERVGSRGLHEVDVYGAGPQGVPMTGAVIISHHPLGTDAKDNGRARAKVRTIAEGEAEGRGLRGCCDRDTDPAIEWDEGSFDEVHRWGADEAS